MQPVSIALGGVFALVLTGAAAAEPLNPQPLPPGRHALNSQPLPPGRQAGAAYLLTTECASGKHAPTARKAGGTQGQPAAASYASGGGAGKVQTACASGKH
jgi:hypothetical protein